MKKLLVAVALSILAFTASANPLENHLNSMNVNYALTKVGSVPVHLIVMSGSPKQYLDVEFLCRMAEEYGGIDKVVVYDSFYISEENGKKKNVLKDEPIREEKACK